jgi:flagellar protein FlaJ
MTPLQETIDTLVFKYDIRREYFTILLPVILGITLILVAFMTGHTLTAQQQQATSSKQQAFEQLIQQMNQGNTTTTAAAPQTNPDLDQYIIIGGLIAITPYSIDRYLEKRRHRQREEDFTQFLFKLSELMRSGIDPIKAVIELSKTDLGSITPYVQSTASMMLLGKSFEEGMKSMAVSLKSDMITKYVNLVVQASYTGGSVHELILKASEDMRAMLMIDKEMLGNLSQYTLILYLAQAILVFVAYILTTQLVPFIQGSGSSMLFGNSDLQNINFTQSFFHLIMINAAISGVIVGKITEGSAIDGLKHSAILMVSCYLVCILVIIPAGTGGTANYIITVVSGNGQTVYPGLPAQQPVVFKVTNTNGNPQPNVYVQFSIQPSGSVNPSYDTTNNSSLVSVVATTGYDSGKYTITAKAGSTTQQAMIYANENTGT